MNENSFSVVEFIEIAVRDEDRRNLEARLCSRLFEEVDELDGAPIALWERDGVRLLLNHGDEGYASDFKSRQGTGPVSIGLVAEEPQDTWRKSTEAGAWPVGEYIRPDLPFPALFGPDDVLVYFTTGLRKGNELRWSNAGPTRSASTNFSLYVDDEPARREWNFWLGEVLCLPCQDATLGQREFGDSGGLRFSSRHQDADLFFAGSRAIRGISFSPVRPNDRSHRPSSAVAMVPATSRASIRPG